MSDEPLWLDRDELHLLYARQVELFGGSFGVRDENLVESALHRPRMRFTYDADADLFDFASGYLLGFVDGNKRIGLAAALSFLGANGWWIEAPGEELLALVLAVATSEVGEPEVATSEVGEPEAAAWLRKHAVRED